MRIPVNPAVIGLWLLAATHLAVPGGVEGQPDLPYVPIEQRALPESVEDASGWRVDPSPGLVLEFEVALPPVSFVDLEPGPELRPEPPLPPRVVDERPWFPVSVEARAGTPAAPKYEVEDNHYVRHFLDRFQTGYRRAVVETWLSRSGRYLPMLLDVFRQKGLPDDLVFTAMIESGFNPLAVSRAGAKGLWQFMAPTARRYGLRVDHWLDERLDPEKSTIAAARHLLDLYAVFGSWNLVQAAYNAGEMRVLQAIKSMATSDFWTLRSGRVLPDETKDFIPAIHAATLIAREPERYGFVFTPAEPLRYDVVTVPRSTSLKVLAEHSGVPAEVLERLNPELRLKQTPPDSPYSLKVPVGSTRLVQTALDQYISVRPVVAARRADLGRGGKAPPAIHVVKPQETVRGIAKRYGVSVAEIVRWNNLQETGLIRPGDRLRIAALSAREEGQGSLR
jgi:membrane-bound lytic murein transglycosylase D